jgi:hypothetical protein
MYIVAHDHKQRKRKLSSPVSPTSKLRLSLQQQQQQQQQHVGNVHCSTRPQAEKKETVLPSLTVKQVVFVPAAAAAGPAPAAALMKRGMHVEMNGTLAVEICN